MILAKIKSHIQLNGRVSLYDLKLRFNKDPEIIRDMLQIFIQKGQLTQSIRTPHCQTRCHHCDPTMTEMYEWVRCEANEPV